VHRDDGGEGINDAPALAQAQRWVRCAVRPRLSGAGEASREFDDRYAPMMIG
jgi:hypothetical protein